MYWAEDQLLQLQYVCGGCSLHLTTADGMTGGDVMIMNSFAGGAVRANCLTPPSCLTHTVIWLFDHCQRTQRRQHDLPCLCVCTYTRNSMRGWWYSWTPQMGTLIFGQPNAVVRLYHCPNPVCDASKVSNGGWLRMEDSWMESNQPTFFYVRRVHVRSELTPRAQGVGGGTFTGVAMRYESGW